jgi:hypothetical protein
MVGIHGYFFFLTVSAQIMPHTNIIASLQATCIYFSYIDEWQNSLKID